MAIKRNNVSFPVGKVDRLQMYPMSFSEFLRADGGEALYEVGQKYGMEREIPELPLSFCSDATFFKVYMSDVGLLRKKSGISYKTILEDSEMYKNFKGAFTENYVLNELIKQKINPYFWRSGNTAELDFLFEYEDVIVPVEAKAEIHTRAKSYRQYCKKYNPQIGFKFSMKNVGIHEVEGTKTFSVPLDLIWMVKEMKDIWRK